MSADRDNLTMTSLESAACREHLVQHCSRCTAGIQQLTCAQSLKRALPCAQVHRQTAASVVQHMALGVAGLGCEDALTHLLNYVWPNIFETSPHVVNAVQGAVDGCRLALGPAIVLNYLLQVRRSCDAHGYCQDLTCMHAHPSMPGPHR